MAASENYHHRLLAICKKEKIDTILPLSIEETIILKQQAREFATLGTKIANSNTLSSIHLCNDKAKTLAHLQNHNVVTPRFYAISNARELRARAHDLGYPERSVVFKPRVTHGSRGFRILTAHPDRLDDLINKKPTDCIKMTLDDLLKIVGQEQISCLVMEYLPGDDFSVHTFSLRGLPLAIVPMKRTGLLPGMSTGGIFCNDSSISDYVARVLASLRLSGSINVQLKNTDRGPRLYEVNTRISSSTVFTRPLNLNFPLLEILLAHENEEQLRASVDSATLNLQVSMERIHKEVFRIDANYFDI